MTSFIAEIYKSGDSLRITVPKILHEEFKDKDKVQVTLEMYREGTEEERAKRKKKEEKSEEETNTEE